MVYSGFFAQVLLGATFRRTMVIGKIRTDAFAALLIKGISATHLLADKAYDTDALIQQLQGKAYRPRNPVKKE